MSLTEKISADLMAAMKAKDSLTLDALRAAKTAFTIARTAKGAEAVLTPEEEIKILQKLVKQRHESAEIYQQNNRPDLFEKEMAEANILKKYLPAKMSDDELTTAVKIIIEHTGAKTPADIGRVMGMAMKELAGKAEGREISEKVKLLLGS